MAFELISDRKNMGPHTFSFSHKNSFSSLHSSSFFFLLLKTGPTAFFRHRSVIERIAIDGPVCIFLKTDNHPIKWAEDDVKIGINNGKSRRVFYSLDGAIRGKKWWVVSRSFPQTHLQRRTQKPIRFDLRPTDGGISITKTSGLQYSNCISIPIDNFYPRTIRYYISNACGFPSVSTTAVASMMDRSLRPSSIKGRVR